ncbi:aspartate ammonia-lyase [Hydrogenimonas sp.]|nr:aspartate ammonia-lyase [Hydrogenimonas sp.]
MRVFILFAVSICSSASLYASTLEIYRDGALYSFKPSGTFVGFAPKNSSAECGDNSFSPVPVPECPQNNGLCKLKKQIDAMGLDLERTKREMDYIDRLIEEVKPESAEKLLQISKASAARYAELSAEKIAGEKLLKSRRELFFKMAPSLEPMHLPKPCSGELKLTLPAGYINFDLLYEADISNPDRIIVTKHLGVTNRSGVDISADSAMLYYRPMHRYLQPVHFRPWLIRERRPMPQIRTLQKSAAPMAADLELEAAPAYKNVESRGVRSYKIERLDLPSSGERIDIRLQSWENGAEAAEMVYPYRDRRVYRVIRFRPKNAIESSRWKVKEGKKIIASNVKGEYLDGYYTLFVSVDEDLAVSRKKLFLKEKESFFGGTLRKKDGYEVSVVNQSAEKKRLTIIERIPVATRSDVEVKLLKVTSERKVSYRAGKNGKLTIELTIPARSSASVEVLFEVSYDKEKPIFF